MRLSGRRIILTGGASGIGEAVALLFAEEGAKLGIIDVNAQGLDSIISRSGAKGAVCDLEDGAAIDLAVEKLAADLGGIDGVVNCAGIRFSKFLPEQDPESWRRMMAVNLDAPYRICRASLPHLTAQPKATIVNVSSGQALLPSVPGISAYATSKAGLVAFTKVLAAELAPSIRVNAICPGLVATPMVAEFLGGEDPDKSEFAKQYALKRSASAREIAEVALFLTSDASSYITGVALAADGGRTFH